MSTPDLETEIKSNANIQSRDAAALRHRVYGVRFLERWQKSSSFDKLGLLLGKNLSELKNEAVPNDVAIPPLHERKSIRDQIGKAIEKTDKVPFGRLQFAAMLIPIALQHISQRKLESRRKAWDIGLPNDLLIDRSLSTSEIANIIDRRRADLSEFAKLIPTLSNLKPTTTFDVPLLYVSGMAYRETPSGYGVRTQTLLSALESKAIKTSLVHMAFSATTQHPEEDIAVTLNETGEISVMLDQAVAQLTAKAQADTIQTIAAGSNWMNGLCALRAARSLGLGFIYDVRGLWPMTRAAVETAYIQQPAFKKQMALEWAVMRAADKVMVISEPLRDLAIHMGVKADNIAVVPNMIHAPDKASPENSKDKSVWTIGHAGSLTSYEGLDVLLHVAAQKPELAGRPLQIWIAGTGVYEAALKAKMQDLNLETRITFLGRVSRHEILERIKTSDVMVYPRQNSPVFQLVPALKPVEAMLLGTPVLLSNLDPHRVLAGPQQTRAKLAKSPTAGDWDNADVLQDWSAALKHILEQAETCRTAKEAQQWCFENRRATVAIQPWLDCFRRPTS